MLKLINYFICAVVLVSSLFRVDLGYGLNPTSKKLDLSDYELVWSDDFEGDTLNSDKWNDAQNVNTLHWGEIRKGGYWHKDMISVKDGNLHIGIKYLSEEEAVLKGENYHEGWYTGYVTTWLSNPENTLEPDAFLYGYYECRCILPKGEGLWSAFWMMNEGVYQENGTGTDGTEIDIFESDQYLNDGKKTSDQISVNLHWDGYGDAHQNYHVGGFYPENPYEEYNTYGVLWTPDEYVFYINGKECARTDRGGVSQNPECLLLSVEIAGDKGVAYGHGDITANTENPSDFIVDYVRVYQAK